MDRQTEIWGKVDEIHETVTDLRIQVATVVERQSQPCIKGAENARNIKWMWTFGVMVTLAIFTAIAWLHKDNNGKSTSQKNTGIPADYTVGARNGGKVCKVIP